MDRGLFPVTVYSVFFPESIIILYHITELRKQATQRPSGMMEGPVEEGKSKK